MLYKHLRALLFKLSPECAHVLTLGSLNLFHKTRINKLLYKKIPQAPIEVMGLKFPNKIGLAAGLDKNGDYIDALADLGFGFIEIGTVTPLAQEGNPKPRLFRIPEASALINRMGFNNKGIDHLIAKVRQSHYGGILGINIGKNAATPIEKAQDDYLICLRKAYPYASYITINISSPNTSGLRSLQHGEYLNTLLKTLKDEQAKLADIHHKYVPLVVKIAPDLTEAEVLALAHTFLQLKIDGVIATNTTISRSGVGDHRVGKEIGGLSGAPLSLQSTEIIKLFHRELAGRIPLIASGGIMSAAIVAEKLAAGATLVQLYTGLIYAGPDLVNECARRI